MRAWTEKSLQKYCRFILGRDIQVVFKSFEELGHDALVHPASQTLFYSDPHLPRWVVYHECGHLFMSNSDVAPRSIAESIDYSPRRNRLLIRQNAINYSDVAFEEYVQHERYAHLWALGKAIELGSLKLVKELVDAIDEGWDEVPIYREARKLLQEDLKKIRLN